MDKQALIDYMVNELDLELDDLTEDAPLFSSGIMDSFMLIDLITYIEKTADIKVTATEVSLDNFDTIGNMLSFMAKKTV